MSEITQFIGFKHCDSLKTLVGKLPGISFSVRRNGGQRERMAGILFAKTKLAQLFIQIN